MITAILVAYIKDRQKTQVPSQTSDIVPTQKAVRMMATLLNQIELTGVEGELITIPAEALIYVDTAEGIANFDAYHFDVLKSDYQVVS